MTRVNGYETSKCRGCGKPVVWATAKREDGKLVKVPLDPRAPVYIVTQGPLGIEAVRHAAAMVSHFATCPKADQFSASRRSPAPPIEPPTQPATEGDW